MGDEKGAAVNQHRRTRIAHRILDRVRSGDSVSLWRVDWALRALGDLR